MSDQNMSAAGDGGDGAAQTAPPGDSAAQTAPGAGAPEPNAPEGGDQTQGDAAAQNEPPAVDKVAIHDEMNVVYGKGYKGGIDKGKRDLAKSFGFETVSELEQHFKHQAQAKEAAGQDQQAQEAAALRTLREQNADLEERLTKSDALNARFQTQRASVLRAEVRAKFVGLGAHAPGVDDLVDIAAKNLAWAADGEAIEVLTTIAGERQPSHESLDDYLTRTKAEKGFFFAPPGTSGSSDSNQDLPPRRPTDPKEYDFRRNLQRLTGGGK